MEFKGCYVALVTPFKANGEIDYEAYRNLIEWQIQEGISGIVPCGCTGEAATLSHEEQKELITFVVEVVKKRVPVIAGTGSNNTKEALELTRHADKVGADGALLITPYYNKPTPQGQYEHYKKIAQAVSIPLMLYNVPSRTGINLLPETVARLAEIDNIVAIKEASSNMEQISKILTLCDIQVLSGDDSLTLPVLAVGGIGVVSVVANIIPREFTQLVNSFLAGQVEQAQKAHQKYFPLCKGMFIETNPIPVKTALKLMGKITGDLRLPLVPLQKTNEEKLKQILKNYQLI